MRGRVDRNVNSKLVDLLLYHRIQEKGVGKQAWKEIATNNEQSGFETNRIVKIATIVKFCKIAKIVKIRKKVLFDFKKIFDLIFTSFEIILK